MRGADETTRVVPARSGRHARSGSRPGGVGWWQTPKVRRGAAVPLDPQDAARHRVGPASHEGGGGRRRAVDDTTVAVAPVAPGPARPGGRRRAGARRRPSPALSPAQRTRRRRRLVARAVLGSAAAVLLAPVLAFALGYLLFPVPDPDDAVDKQVALIAFADGTQLTRLVPEQGNRMKVPVDAVPLHVRQAVLAAEDRSFYSNPGFDLTGILRAAWNQLRGGVGGGSTITQQYVKQTLVGDDANLWRKYKEVVVAVKLSQQRTKDEILGDYLNAIYFGRGAWGVQSASHAYFGKPVDQLTPVEGAVLAGLIQSPSRWDPAINPDKAVARWEFVLDGMVAQGWLGRDERERAAFPATVARRPASGGVPGDHRGHIVTAIKAELEELGITEQDLSKEGLRISTTIDPVRQQQAVEAAHQGLAGQPPDLRSSMVAVDPATGGVLAYYGGDNGTGLDYARVRRLAGSTFKPFVVLAGLQSDPPVGLGEVFDGDARPGLRNASGAECDRCDLKQAMTVSNNVVFSTLARKVGPERVADAARLAGINAPLDGANEGIALGNKEVSTYELASAYATIASGGVWHQPHLVARVVTADDRVLYEADTVGERRFPERIARNVTETMLGVAERDGLDLPGHRPVAAKTGTVESRFDGENNDAWMAGFTPQLSASVWVGTDMNSPIRTATGDPISGKTVPGEVWRGFMVDALRDEPVEDFAAFKPIGKPPAPTESEVPAATSTPSATSTAPPSGTATAVPEDGAVPTGEPGEDPDAPGGPAPGPRDPQPDDDADPPEEAEPEPDDREPAGAAGEEPAPAAPGGTDCSQTPCG